MKHILSIQSHVAYGYVGNRAAVFPLQRLGYDVTAVNTVQFSNHTGYGSWQGDVHSLAHIDAVLQGIKAQHRLSSYDAIVSGYMGDADLAALISDFVNQAKQSNPRLVYCCDPVMGDIEQGFYVQNALLPFFRQCSSKIADIMTPNLFELSYLSDMEITDQQHVLQACQRLHQAGVKIVLVTSVRFDTHDSKIIMFATSVDRAWRITTPRFDFAMAPSGGGDMTSAIFLAKYLAHGKIAEALQFTANAMYELFALTHQRGQRELAMIEGQESLVSPQLQFEVEEITEFGGPSRT